MSLFEYLNYKLFVGCLIISTIQISLFLQIFTTHAISYNIEYIQQQNNGFLPCLNLCIEKLYRKLCFFSTTHNTKQ